ncbi:toll-like receptor 4 [Diadema antillarum]|uniref:toll-like receptor 4 n=1 Tax=Diadema antillarum TaxID=105358 RepID=UPI003A878BAD
MTTFSISTRTSLTLAMLTGVTGFFLQLLLLPAPSTSLTFDQEIASLPAACQYLVKSYSVNCSRRGLTKIPSDIPLDTRRLSLSYNLLDQILNGSLGRLLELEFLSLRYNRIRLIDVGAFIGLPRLQTINLIGNNLTRIPSQVFHQNLYMTDLFLNSNRFRSIPSLDLRRHNYIKSIDLSNNTISSAKFNIALASGCNLTNVALIDNEIQLIDESDLENLRSANSVEFLDFSGNSLHRVNIASFQGVRIEGLQLQRSLLSQAGVRELFEGVRNSSHLTYLGLNGTNLGGVTKSVFAPLQGSQVTRLHLSASNISYLPDNVFSYLTNIDVLSLNKNPLKTISFVAFTNMTSAKSLYLSSCTISQLMTPQTPGTLMPQLFSLNLGNNNLVEIGPSAFVALPKLIYLDLSFNIIRHIASDAFAGLEHLENILLDNNNLIDAFSVNVFHNLPVLRVLDVSHSNINGLDPLRSFSGLTTLEELILAENPLRASDLWDSEKNVSVFRDMCNLRTLDLTGTILKDDIPSWGFEGLK